MGKQRVRRDKLFEIEIGESKKRECVIFMITNRVYCTSAVYTDVGSHWG